MTPQELHNFYEARRPDGEPAEERWHEKYGPGYRDWRRDKWDAALERKAVLNSMIAAAVERYEAKSLHGTNVVIERHTEDPLSAYLRSSGMTANEAIAALRRMIGGYTGPRLRALSKFEWRVSRFLDWCERVALRLDTVERALKSPSTQSP